MLCSLFEIASAEVYSNARTIVCTFLRACASWVSSGVCSPGLGACLVTLHVVQPFGVGCFGKPGLLLGFAADSACRHRVLGLTRLPWE